MTNQKLLVTGGAGYIGAVLVPELLEEGHHVTVFDAFLYGTDPKSDPIVHERCKKIRRRYSRFRLWSTHVLRKKCGFDAVIHLAAISNDPSSELDHEVTETVNLRGGRLPDARGQEDSTVRAVSLRLVCERVRHQRRRERDRGASPRSDYHLRQVQGRW